MKQYWLMFGQTGARIARTLLLLLSAGSDAPEEARLLLADTDAANASLRQAEEMANTYRAVREMGLSHECFAALTAERWPETFSAGGVTSFSDGSEGDQLLLQAFFTPEEQRESLKGGFKGNDAIAGAVMADLLAADSGDALHRLLAEAKADGDAGRPCQVFLCGCTEGGMGRAGLRQMAALLRETLGDAVPCRALLVMPGMEENAAIRLADSLLPERFPRSLCLERQEAADTANAWDLVMLHHLISGEAGMPLEVLSGPEGGFRWQSFGKDALFMLDTLGRFLRGAALFPVLSDQAVSLLENPGFLRERAQGWYRAYFRKENREGFIEPLRQAKALCAQCLTVIGEMDRTLPPRWRYAEGISAAYAEAEAHYLQLLDLTAETEVLRREAKEQGLEEENLIHRHNGSGPETEAEAALRRVELLAAEAERLREEQRTLNLRIGGRLTEVLISRREKQCRLEAAQLREEADEAERRIDQADRVAREEERHLVDNARTRLQRMRRRLTLLDTRVRLCAQDRESMRTTAFEPDPEWERDSWLVTEPGITACLSADRRAVEEQWPSLLAGVNDTVSVQGVLRTLPGLGQRKNPVGALLSDVMDGSMGEVR